MSWKSENRNAKVGSSAVKGKHPWSLAMRLTIWYAGSATAILLAATGILYWALLKNLDLQDDQFLVDEVQILRNLLVDRPEYVNAIRQEIEWEASARQYAHVYVRLLDRKGLTIAETPGMSEMLPTHLFPDAIADGDVMKGMDALSRDGTPYRILTAQFAEHSPAGVGELQVAVDQVQHRQLVGKFRRALLAVAVVSLAISSLAAYLIARRGIRPIGEIGAAARRIRSTTLHERIEARSFPAELSAFAETFNEMLDRLQESFDRLSQFSADIAHELRTPVNNLRGEAEVTLAQCRSPEEYRDALGSSLEESVRLSRIIDGLLLLARAESPQTEFQREPIDLASELKAVREFYEAAAAEAGVHFEVDARPGLRLYANRPLVQRAIGNLVENAIAHTPSGGKVRAAAAEQEGRVTISVSDSGSGIPAEDVPHVFDRFYRVERDRSSTSGGSGLGLAIVRSIAQLHGGEVKLASTVGSGTTVTVQLPS